MGKKQYLVRVPRDQTNTLRQLVEHLSKEAEHPKDRLVFRQILRKIPDAPREDSVLNFSQMYLSAGEARAFNDMVEAIELPGGLKAKELKNY